MPETQVYRFVSTTQGQKRPPRRELQRIVRSQAASVSRREHDIRRRRHVGKLNVGEDVIDLGPRPPTQAIPVSQASSAAVARRHRPSTASLPSYSFTPVSSLPTFRRPYLPTLINHYITNLTVPNPQIDGNTTLPLFRQAWVPIILHDPVIFQVIVLFTATHYATFVDSHRFNQVHQELLWLKQSALSILIAKIGSEDVASDTVIAAATKMASYEAIFGTVEAVSHSAPDLDLSLTFTVPCPHVHGRPSPSHAKPENAGHVWILTSTFVLRRYKLGFSARHREVPDGV